MGDAKSDDLRFGFDSRLKFVGSKVTSDAGLLAYRELDEALRLSEMGEEVLSDSRLGTNKQHLLVPLLRQSIYSRLAGYEDVNDADVNRDFSEGCAPLTDSTHMNGPPPASRLPRHEENAQESLLARHEGGRSGYNGDRTGPGAVPG